MINNLVFTSGVSLPICSIDALNTPRIQSGNWRYWHLQADHVTVVSALESGIVSREYESIVGTDENGSQIIETLQENLSEYTVLGSVIDHRDGTVTICARKPTEIERTKAEHAIYTESFIELGVDTGNLVESVEQRLESIRTLVNKADLTDEHSTIVGMLPSFCDEWKADTQYPKGKLLQHNAVKYLVIQPITSQAHYPPDMPNGAMLAHYKPYQGRERYTWLYGEYCEVGFTRYDGAELYECTSDPVANVNPPSQVPSCWKLIN